MSFHSAVFAHWLSATVLILEVGRISPSHAARKPPPSRLTPRSGAAPTLLRWEVSGKNAARGSGHESGWGRAGQQLAHSRKSLVGVYCGQLLEARHEEVGRSEALSVMGRFLVQWEQR